MQRLGVSLIPPLDAMQVHYNVTLLAFHQASLASSRNYGSFRRENFTNKQDQFLSYKRKRIAIYSRHALVLNQTIRSCQTLHPKLKKKKSSLAISFQRNCGAACFLLRGGDAWTLWLVRWGLGREVWVPDLAMLLDCVQG